MSTPPTSPREGIAAAMAFAAEVAQRVAEDERLKNGLTSWRLPPGLSLLVGGPGKGKTQNLINLAREAMGEGLHTMLFSSDQLLLDRLGAEPLAGVGSLFFNYTPKYETLVELIAKEERQRFLILVDDLDLLAQDQVTAEEATELGAVARKLAFLTNYFEKVGREKEASVLATYTPPRSALPDLGKFQGPAALSPFPCFVLV